MCLGGGGVGCTPLPFLRKCTLPKSYNLKLSYTCALFLFRNLSTRHCLSGDGVINTDRGLCGGDCNHECPLHFPTTTWEAAATFVQAGRCSNTHDQCEVWVEPTGTQRINGLPVLMKDCQPIRGRAIGAGVRG